MNYSVNLSNKARKQLKQMDRHQSKILLLWITQNLEDCVNPRLHGKPLVGDKKGYWRYRVGDYRIIADIKDKEIVIEIITIGHRREVYED